MRRRRLRIEKPEFKLFSAGGPLGPKVIRMITSKVGDRLVSERKAVLIHYEELGIYVYQMLTDGVCEVKAKQSQPSSTAFSAAELEAIVGIRGESRTETMREIDKLKRISRGLSDMDLVQAARVKLEIYQGVH